MRTHPYIDSNLREAAISFIRSQGQTSAPFENIRRKLIPGIRFFECSDCGITYEEKTRDCFSPSVESCPNCFADNSPFKNEEYPKFPVDKSGNLI